MLEWSQSEKGLLCIWRKCCGVALCCVRARVMWLLCSAVFFKVSQNENISSCTSGDNVRDRQ